MHGSARDRQSAAEDLAALQGLYSALGPGLPIEVERVFAGDGAPGSGEWCARHRGRGLVLAPQSRWRCFFADEDLSAERLFSLPPGWELTRARLTKLQGERTRRGDQLSAQGTFFCRLRGSPATDPLPFLHLWTMCAGRALRFESYLDGLELRRARVLEGCPAKF
jgi:hypothetical protein